MKRIEVGYICGKGSGHFSLAGEIDYGTCESHIVGRIYMESNSEKINLQDQADSLEKWIYEAEFALSKLSWDRNR